VRSPDDGVGTGRFLDDDLGGAHIDELHVAEVIYHDVLRFEITVHYFVVMEVFYGQDHLADVELGVIGVKETDFSNDIEKLHSFNVFNQEIYILIINKSTVKIHNKRVIHLRTDQSFLLQVLLHLLLLNLGLVDALDGVLLIF